PLPAERGIRRRPQRPGGDVLHVLVLVRRVPVAHGRPAQGALLLREDARLRQPPRALRRGAGPAGPAPRQLPAGLHPPGTHHRRLRPRSAAVPRRPCPPSPPPRPRPRPPPFTR